MTKVAVIPARGGSTRLKNKNIYPLGGKPLIAHTIEAVIESNCFDKIIVSTDAPAIADVAKQYKDVEIYNREPEFSGERVTVVSAMLDMMSKIERYDTFSYFLPTCPFRNAEDIKKGIHLLTPDVDSVISACFLADPPQLAMIQGHDDFAYPVFDNLRAGVTNSKYFTKYIKPSGGFYMGWWERILENKYFFTGNIKYVLTPKERAVDIDDELDMKFAELVFSQLK